MREADHEESSPDASLKLISKLSCSLVGQQHNVQILPGTEAHKIYGKEESIEIFACNYGLNESFRDALFRGGLIASGFDEDSTVRIVELPQHPFFVTTLFVPQMLSAPGNPHPFITAFVNAAARFRLLRTT